MKISTKRLVAYALVAAVYVVLTLGFAPISYGNIQFRVSEVLTLLPFFNPGFIIPLALGTFIANMFSPLGWPDMVFGTLATVIAVIGVSKMKNLFVASLWPVVVNAIIVGLELTVLFKLPMWLTMFEVGFGEFVVVSIAGVALFTALSKNKSFMNFIKNI